jgi:hypothetical protein
MEPLEHQVETAIMAVIARQTYIVANAIPVRHWRNAQNDARVPKAITVHCSPRGADGETMQERGPLWVAPVEAAAWSWINEDQSATAARGMYKAIMDAVETTAATTLSAAASNLTFTGLEVLTGTDAADTGYHRRSVTLNAYVHKTS